ncbi:hypothetical protein PPERSA_02667 [Pseudocohnilembus persalinus]|uniref:Uncharacterized protein n=1 Tax=Pseudocohnilembus persalinus TaxID=266149 RepID=A0A0V0R5N5_PSEPJ|nr:hypothetical protein PPERSA_02667 [Pseudocohnilembus persalinus]|eukprot:KRX09795.1 hypothetical protein PPERSA_02667 [Pseudocohnilembus persalinus]
MDSDKESQQKNNNLLNIFQQNQLQLKKNNVKNKEIAISHNSSMNTNVDDEQNNIKIQPITQKIQKENEINMQNQHKDISNQINDQIKNQSIQNEKQLVFNNFITQKHEQFKENLEKQKSQNINQKNAESQVQNQSLSQIQNQQIEELRSNSTHYKKVNLEITENTLQFKQNKNFQDKIQFKFDLPALEFQVRSQIPNFQENNQEQQNQQNNYNQCQQNQLQNHLSIQQNQHQIQQQQQNKQHEQLFLTQQQLLFIDEQKENKLLNINKGILLYPENESLPRIYEEQSMNNSTYTNIQQLSQLRFSKQNKSIASIQYCDNNINNITPNNSSCNINLNNNSMIKQHHSQKQLNQKSNKGSSVNLNMNLNNNNSFHNNQINKNQSLTEAISNNNGSNNTNFSNRNSQQPSDQLKNYSQKVKNDNKISNSSFQKSFHGKQQNQKKNQLQLENIENTLIRSSDTNFQSASDTDSEKQEQLHQENLFIATDEKNQKEDQNLNNTTLADNQIQNLQQVQNPNIESFLNINKPEKLLTNIDQNKSQNEIINSNFQEKIINTPNFQNQGQPQQENDLEQKITNSMCNLGKLGNTFFSNQENQNNNNNYSNEIIQQSNNIVNQLDFKKQDTFNQQSSLKNQQESLIEIEELQTIKINECQINQYVKMSKYHTKTARANYEDQFHQNLKFRIEIGNFIYNHKKGKFWSKSSKQDILFFPLIWQGKLKRIPRLSKNITLKIYHYELLGPFLCYYDKPIDRVCKGYVRIDKNIQISKGMYKGMYDRRHSFYQYIIYWLEKSQSQIV